jgi:aminocarboxymuconate-semialdehyde decarboxylase
MSETSGNIWNRYAPTAARRHGRPGRELRPASTTIDIHAHVFIQAAADYIAPYTDMASHALNRFAVAETKELNKRQDAERRPRMAGVDDRFADMEAMGLDWQLVSPAPPQCYYAVPAEIGATAARLINDGIAAYVAQHPDRLAALGSVPMQDGEAAASELEYAVKTLGFKGVEILTNVAGRELADPDFAAFWAKAEELGAWVFIHPSGFTHGERLGRFYFSNVIGNPLETAIALHYLIFDGVLERHPGLKIVAAHGGGFLGAYHGRIDHAWGARSDSRGALPHPPSSYLKRLYFDSIVFTPEQLRALVAAYGADRIMIGTDFPFDMGEYDPIGHLVEAGLSAEEIAAIAGGNAQRLFGIATAAG